MEGGSITLIVKAANQSVPDHRLECDALWTVQALKDHLAVAHLLKPRVEEQRLIYSGQLLLDNLLLRSVLRHPTENNAYTIHLVCSPPRNQPISPVSVPSPTAPLSTQQSPLRGGATPSGMAAHPSDLQSGSQSSHTTASTTSSSADNPIGDATEGLRRRTVNTPSEDAPSASQPQGIEASTGYPTQAQMSMGFLQATADPIQQMATMQQMYASYMAYMQYIQMSTGGLTGGVPWPQQVVHHLPSANPAAPSPAGVLPVGETREQQQTQPPEQNAAVNRQEQQQVAAAPIPQIRNLHVEGNLDDEDEDNEGLGGRDWLDWIYVLSKMVVFLWVVYICFNIKRFLMVAGVALFLYLYEGGWFRRARRVGEAQEQQQQQQQQPLLREANEPVDAQDDRNNNVNNNNNNNNNAVHEPNDLPNRPQVVNEATPARPSILALSWTFLTNFLISLLPEHPQVV